MSKKAAKQNGKRARFVIRFTDEEAGVIRAAVNALLHAASAQHEQAKEKLGQITEDDPVRPEVEAQKKKLIRMGQIGVTVLNKLATGERG